MRPGRFDRQVTVDAPDIKGHNTKSKQGIRNQEELTLRVLQGEHQVLLRTIKLTNEAAI